MNAAELKKIFRGMLVGSLAAAGAAVLVLLVLGMVSKART